MRKFSLIFIKISSSILALDLFLKLMLIYFPINLLWIEVTDIILKMVLGIGLVILSYTFKYCGYHRSLFYIVLLGYIFYLLYLFTILNVFWIVLIIISLLVIILLTFFIIYKHINGGTIKNNSRK